MNSIPMDTLPPDSVPDPIDPDQELPWLDDGAFQPNFGAAAASDDPSDYPVTVMLDDIAYTSKSAAEDHIADLTHRLPNGKTTLGLADLADALTKGHSFVPAVLEGGRKKSENWKAQQVFALDFDGGVTVAEHLQVCKNLDTWPVFIYPSFSHTNDNPRFRSVFVTERPVDEPILRDQIYDQLLSMFPKADQKCKDRARLFFGTNRPTVYENWEARVPVPALPAQIQAPAVSTPVPAPSSSAPSEQEAVQLLAKHWKKGQRNDLSLALSGLLVRAGWDDGRIEALIRQVCQKACDTEAESRVRTIAETSQKSCQGDNFTGGPKLKSLIGDDVEYARFCRCLGIASAAPKSELANGGKAKIVLPIEERNRYTDEGNAKAFEKLHREKITFVASSDINDWAAWDGTKWRVRASSEAFRMCCKTLDSLQAEAMSDEDTERGNRMLDHVVKSRNRKGLRNMMDVAKHLESLQTQSTDFDRIPELINHPNGIVSLRKMELLPHAPEYRMTKCSATRFTATGPEPENWLRTLAYAFGDDDDLITWFGKSIARSFLYQGNRDIFYICYGTGANGKSTIFETLRHVFGADYIATADPSTFMRETEATRNALARLRGVKLVIGSESPDGSLFNEALMKRVTSGEEIEAKSLYKDIFTFTPEFTMFFLTNHKPVIRGTDYGIWRRARLVPFPYRIPESERDPHILQKLVDEEAEGIVRWLYQHLALFLSEGEGTLPEAVRKATAEYQQDSNITLNFLTEYCVAEEEAEISLKEMYKAYARYRQSRGMNPGRDYGLKADLEKMNVTIKRQRNGYVVYGYNFEPAAIGDLLL